MRTILQPIPLVRRGRAYAVALALLLASSGGAAAEELRIGGSGAALGTMQLLGEEFTARM